jgi:hypothetical protein
MEVQFIIKGTYGEVAEFAQTIYEGLGARGACGKMEHVYDPHPEPSFSRGREDDREPAYYEDEHHLPELNDAPTPAPSPEVEGEVLTVVNKATGKPIQLQRKKTKFNGAKLNVNMDAGKNRTTGKREHAPDDLQIHCHTCGKLFHPRYADMVHCGKACYMVEWRETHKSKKEAKPVGCNNAPLAVPGQKKVLSETELEHLSQKLREIKASCPAPKGRPDFTRDINV